MKNRKRLQRIISVVLAIVLALSSGTEGEAYAATSPGIGTILKSGGNTYVVTKVKSEVEFDEASGSKTSITIPKTVKIGGITYKVTSINGYAFWFNKTVKKVTIGDNVTTIGRNAFGCCENLSNVKMGSGIKKIGEDAFNGCERLKSITIPGGVTEIDNGVFAYCERLNSITIPKDVKKICASAFYYCSGLKTITIKSTKLTSVERYAFYGINSKAKIKVPGNKLKSYKKLLKGKGQDETVKVVAAKVKLKSPKMKITMDQKRKRFTISWKTVNGASKMQIYRAVGNGTFKKWKTVSAKKGKATYSYQSLKKGEYRFVLRAYYSENGGNVYSEFSNALRFKI